VALAVAGWRNKGHRRLTWWLTGIAALFLLIGMGSATPFYSLWYEVAPFVKKTRAPGMALYIVSFVLAVFAAFGAQRIENKETPTAGRTWMVVGGVLFVLGVGGLFAASRSRWRRSGHAGGIPLTVHPYGPVRRRRHSPGRGGQCDWPRLVGLLALVWTGSLPLRIAAAIGIPLMIADTIVVANGSAPLAVAAAATWIGLVGSSRRESASTAECLRWRSRSS